MFYIFNLAAIIATTIILSDQAYGGIIPSRDAKNRTEAICAGKDTTASPELKQFCSKSGKLAKILFHCTDTGNAKGVCDSPNLCKSQSIYDACKKFCIDTRRTSKPDAKTLSIQKNLNNPGCLAQLRGSAPSLAPKVLEPKPPRAPAPKPAEKVVAPAPIAHPPQTPVPPQETLDSDALPKNITARNNLLKNFHTQVISKLIALQWNSRQLTNESLDTLVSGFYTPYPFNPYREPGMDKLFMLPTSHEALSAVIRTFKKREEAHKNIIGWIDTILNQNSLEMRGPDPALVLEALSFPRTFSQRAFDDNKQLRSNLLDHAFNEVPIMFDLNEKQLLTQFRLYHQTQLNKLTQIKMLLRQIPDKKQFFNNLVSTDNAVRLQARKMLDKLRPFFLIPVQDAHDLIHVKPLQVQERGDAQVIVYDNDALQSTHVQNVLQTSQPTAHHWRDKSHGVAVSAIIAGKEKLEQLKGVAPGAQVINIDEITPETLKIIKNSSARVMNISLLVAFPQKCSSYFSKYSQGQFTPDTSAMSTQCATWWNFIELIKKKDMIITLAAGNEGVQLNKASFLDGTIYNTPDRTNRTPGLQYLKVSHPNLSTGSMPLEMIFNEIPQLRDRVILVGDLHKDGVTISNTSSLPGALWEYFIFAPSTGISTVYSEAIAKTADKTKVYSELGKFSGTSGAAPRVAGVFVLLGRIFPDLPMTTIRQCVLKSGDPFWNSLRNKHSWLIPFGNTIEGKAIFGRGIINADKAFLMCTEEQSKRDRVKTRISALDLATSRKSKD